MTCDPQRRYKRHIEQSRRKSKPKDHWIRKQVSQNTFCPITLFSNLSEDEAHIKERELLQQFTPKFNVLTYTTHKHPKKHNKETFEAWMTKHIHKWVNHFIQT